MFAQILMPLKAHKKSRKFLVRECFNLSKEEFIRWYLLAYAEINLLIDNIALFQNIKSLVVMGSEDHVFMKVVNKIQPTLKKYCSIKVLNECGHVCCLQKWRDYNEMVRNFYSTLLPAPKEKPDMAKS